MHVKCFCPLAGLKERQIFFPSVKDITGKLDTLIESYNLHLLVEAGKPIPQN